MPTAKDIQLPLIQSAARPIELTFADITPVCYLDCQEPDAELISSIAEFGVPTIVVCPDNRYQTDGRQMYYPIDGKRRIKAVGILAEMDYKFGDTLMLDLKIPALLRDDLEPQDEEAYRMAFQANNLRSPNPITNISAVKSTAEALGVDPFTKEGRSAIAKQLRTTPQAVGKMAKGLLVDETVFDAYQEGQIADETLKAVLDMRDIRARQEVTKRLVNGERLTKKDVTAYNKQAKQTTLAEAFTDREPESDVFSSNPLEDAVALLEDVLEGKRMDRSKLEQTLALLKSLL